MGSVCFLQPYRILLKIKSQKKECDWPGVSNINITQRERRHFERTLQKQTGLPTSLNTENVLFSGLDSVSIMKGFSRKQRGTTEGF